MGGYGSAVLESLSEADIPTPLVRIAWPDAFVEHASSVDYLREKHGLTVDRLVKEVVARGTKGRGFQERMSAVS